MFNVLHHIKAKLGGGAADRQSGRDTNEIADSSSSPTSMKIDSPVVSLPVDALSWRLSLLQPPQVELWLTHALCVPSWKGNALTGRALVAACGLPAGEARKAFGTNQDKARLVIAAVGARLLAEQRYRNDETVVQQLEANLTRPPPVPDEALLGSERRRSAYRHGELAVQQFEANLTRPPPLPEEQQQQNVSMNSTQASVTGSVGNDHNNGDGDDDDDDLLRMMGDVFDDRPADAAAADKTRWPVSSDGRTRNATASALALLERALVVPAESVAQPAQTASHGVTRDHEELRVAELRAMRATLLQMRQSQRKSGDWTDASDDSAEGEGDPPPPPGASAAADGGSSDELFFPDEPVQPQASAAAVVVVTAAASGGSARASRDGVPSSGVARVGTVPPTLSATVVPSAFGKTRQ